MEDSSGDLREFDERPVSSAGVLTLGPGGLSRFGAANVGLLIVIGLPSQIAVAATVLQRAADKGLATIYGVQHNYMQPGIRPQESAGGRRGERRGHRTTAGTRAGEGG